jgi:hypothetical protein
MAGFVVGTLIAQFAASWAYWRMRGDDPSRPSMEVLSGTVGGVVAALVSTALYIPTGVHTWVMGDEGSWPVSAFLGFCVGLVYGVLFRGRPWRPGRRTTSP